jgi:transcriptional regulator with XRE-family HTH domain
MPLGKKLFDLRATKNITQEQVAYDLDIVQSTYSDWENSISVPKRENLLKIANYFEIPISELEEEIYKIAINNKKNAIAVVNSPNVKINATDAILKISDSLEKLTLLVEKLILKQ